VKRALLRGEVGRGTFVRSPHAVARDGEQGSLRRRVAGPIDLSRNLPLPGFAQSHIRRALGDIAREEGLPALLDYQTDEELAHHSDAGRMWLSDCGVPAKAERIVTTMGGQHGLFCVLLGLLRPGDLLLTETLTYTPVRAMAERLGLHTAAVLMDAQGVVPEAFETLCRQANPRAFYLTPTLQAPTTITLSRERRIAVAQIAQRYDVLLIEDDVFGPLKADRPPPLAAFASDQTVYVSSLSKCVAPGLRVGFLHTPAHLLPALRNAVNLSVWMTPPATVEVAARLIRDGTAAALTIQQRNAAQYRQGRARVILDSAGLDRAGPDSAGFVADPSGFHIWMPLPQDWRADTFVAQCARHGVLVSEGRMFATSADDAPEAVRLCLSHEASEERVEQGLQTVANLLRLAPSEAMLEI